MDDLIKRSDAIGAITNHCENECYYRVDNWCPQCQREEFEEAIKAVPSADRPQGEWIDAEIPLESGGAMPIQACSLCKTFYPLAYTGGGHRFCPNCGARMKGADDEHRG